MSAPPRSPNPNPPLSLGEQVERLPALFAAARPQRPGDNGSRSSRITPAQTELIRCLKTILEQPLPQEDGILRGGYLQRLIEAYAQLFASCLSGSSSQLQHQALVQTVQRLSQIPMTVIQEDYDRLNRGHYNVPLKQLVLSFSRPTLAQRATPPTLTEAECFLAIFIQALRQQLGSVVLFSDEFKRDYRDLLRSVCKAAPDPELCQSNLPGWLWEAMKSFDPLKAFSATGHGRPTFEAWVRTVVNNKLADEKRKLLKREADELLFYESRALPMFEQRYAAAGAAVQEELDLAACCQLIKIVQSEITDPRIRTSTTRLRQQIAQLLGWTIEYTREIHQQVRRILGRYVQSTRSLNITSTDSNQEWIDNYPDARTLPNLGNQGVDCMVDFLNDQQTPIWVRDWCEKRRTQAEIAAELFVSQPTISRCLGREYRLWLYRRFFKDQQTPEWMRRWYDTQTISSPHQRRQARRDIHPDYARGVFTAKQIDDQIEARLEEWCLRNGIYYLA
ncbi:hypothetical protein RIF25_14845 [Thermosynechococcaceae cyanobacterium BACA0444]|uniref:Uncharacterized protein n=1 Tax=Pseudocalidococcus azoricus BACA0444 TaxID=2918990 RepID=A0AAE4JYD7_9CYAN|nr:hypothetical protein [Pseudocalidococcus azoricus]MDS3862078.1 hypothetical protein [Pseudocalidococcus azoricus BACA0444]